MPSAAVSLLQRSCCLSRRSESSATHLKIAIQPRKKMGIAALYPKPNLSKPNPMHKIYPYLLKGVTAQYPNHIVGTDITYIKMTKGFCYLTAFMDWFSRFVLSWRLSITLETTFCFEAAEEVVKDFGAPIIINEDQGSQNTDQRMTSFWESHGTHISMD